jgi:hypothetical protein
MVRVRVATLLFAAYALMLATSPNDAVPVNLFNNLPSIAGISVGLFSINIMKLY